MKYYVSVTDSETYWYKEADMKILHRENGPAVEYNNGYKAWYIDGKRHHTDGPAVEYSSGAKEWWLNGKLHREDGPAVEYSSGEKEWWLNGKELSEEELIAATNPVVELTVADIEKLLGKKVKIVK